MTSPQTQAQVIDMYFMEHRAKLIDIAAFLDRVHRAQRGSNRKEDFRMNAFRKAITVLADDKPHRAKRVLEVFSDPSMEPLQSAAGLKGAHGAYPG